MSNENKDFKDRLEKRIAHFEDIWSDNNRIKSLFNSDIREEVENLRKEADIKFENYISDLREKMEDIERGIGDWKEGNLNELLNQLNQAKASIEGFVETSENKKEELLSEMLKTIEDKENEIYSQLRDRMDTIGKDIEDWKEGNLNELLNPVMLAFQTAKLIVEEIGQKMNQLIKQV